MLNTTDSLDGKHLGNHLHVAISYKVVYSRFYCCTDGKLVWTLDINS